MNDPASYYKTLEVTQTASSEEIRKAYKKLARKFHPDANPDDKDALEHFKQVQRAWDVLGDEEKRKNYDQYGSPDGPQFQGGAGPSPGGAQRWNWSSPTGGEVPFDLEELFSGFRTGHQPFDRAGTQAREWPIRGQDIRAEIEIPFLLAADGGKYDLHLKRDPSAAAETLSVNIPVGIDSGNVIRLAGQGTPGMNGGQAGDLLVSIQVAPHPWFRRDGTNVLLDLPLTITECALGTKADIPTLRDGTVTLTVPPGTSSGARLRLKGKGIRDRRSDVFGDMFAIIKIVAPKPDAVNDRVRELLSELDETLEQSPRASLWK